jgi:hypothetical protein
MSKDECRITFCLSFHLIFGYEARWEKGGHFRFSDEQRWMLHHFCPVVFRISDMSPTKGQGVILELRMGKDG